MFASFAPLWVLAFFLHHAEDWDHEGITVLALLLTIWTTYARDRVAPFAASLALFSAYNAAKAPHLANHANYYTLVSLFLLAWVAGVGLGLGRRLDEAALARAFPAVRPALGLSLVVVYFMAGFHKLNEGFFDPRVSCASDFFLRWAREYRFSESVFPPLLLDLSPFLVVVIELAGALLLVAPRVQLLGILTFVLLHSYLVPLSFYDFASICYAILLCFLPPAAFEGEANAARAQRGLRALVVAMLVGAVVGRFIEDRPWGDWIEADRAQGWFFLGGSLYLIAQLGRNIRDAGWTLLDFEGLDVLALGPVRPRWMIALPVVLLVFTSTSYLGLRTAGNTTMFSNLRTEGGRSNHFLMPSWQPFGFQQEIIWVREIGEAHAGEMNDQPMVGMGMTRFELRRVAERWRRRGEVVPMAFLYEGREYRFDDVTAAAEWTAPLPWLAQKLMLFREIQPDGPNACRW